MSDIGLTHIALAVADLDVSIAFYEKYAKLKVVHRHDSEDDEGGVVWMSDMMRPFVIVLVHQPGVGDPPLGPFGHLGLACESRDEVDRLVALAKEDGCLVKGPEDYGPPVGYWAYIGDPDGNNLEVSYGQDVGLTVERAKAEGID
jgi:lactoylglutathione lyase